LSKAKIAATAAGLAMLAVPGAALAENWYAFYIMPSGITYVDKDSVVLRPGHVAARLESSFPGPQQLQQNGKIFVYSKSKDQMDIDCTARVYRFLARDLYTDTGVMETSVSDANNPMLIQEGTAPAALAAAYCPQTRR
jgi:hypothetical protein